MPKFPQKLDKKLQERKQENALRVLNNPKGLVDFSSNDYLGFSGVRAIQEQAKKYLEDSGLNQNGASGSRLLTGNHILYNKLEEVLANYHGAESALVFNSGYDANLGFFSSVPQRDDVIFFDELAHASIRDGIGMAKAKSYKFAHNNLYDLKERTERILKAKESGSEIEIYVVTESVFSMDGDSPNLEELANFCEENGFHLVVDEAHAVGIFDHGRSLIEQFGLQQKVFARLITFGKALGAHGAAILGCSKLKTYLVNFARSLIYTTGLPPHTIAVVLSGYDYLKGEGMQNQIRLRRKVEFFKRSMKEMQLEKAFIPSDSAIHCMIHSGNDSVKKLSSYLNGHGYDVKPILSPTVKKGEERLRFCLHEYNTNADISEVLSLIKNYKPE